jgi:riboflavin kinase/FMN adenylyltransferase
VASAVARARELGAPSVLITFEPHPTELVRPGSQPPLLTTQKYRAELVAALGIDVVLVLDFTLRLSQLAPADFVHNVLVDRLHTAAVVVGENFRYGHRAAGNVATLTESGAEWGFTVEGLPLASEGDPVVSSTVVRGLVLAGDVAGAADLLGRPHRVEGTVVRGDQRGRELGFPTANLELPPHTAVPADGVYAGWLVLDVHTDRQTRLPAAISVGTNPTFDGHERRVEAYALDRDDLDLYGTHVAVEFTARVRDQLTFASVDDLIARMSVDVKQIRELLE